ncbi:Noc2p family-domain-containing protein [Coprinopsis sp. MPI-PUGE-AT-0042]|nr:Noc2p family-domain-containing protein [Coprinopsis sp. MPI-PUGE-AT-0042]
MGKKATKATRKIAASGQLKKSIDARRKHQQVKKQIERRKGGKGAGSRGGRSQEDLEDDDGGSEEEDVPKKKGRMTVDDILNADFMAGSDDEDEEEGDEDSEAEEMSNGEDDDNASFASVDDLDDDDEGKRHLMELSELAEKDPEFFKYLQENDRELLNFNAEAMADDEDMDEDEDGDVNMEDEEQVPTLTKQLLQKWQKALLEKSSLRALRRLLVAFRSAAHMNEDDQVLAWRIDSSSVYDKLVLTTLRYTPVVLEHHIPYKTLPNGKFKSPPQNRKFKTLQKLILSYFNNAIHLLGQLTDHELIRLALSESAKLIPYVVSSRRTVKLYLKKCLELWSSADDSIRITAFLSIRKLASSPDESVVDTILKSTYLALVRACKSTSAHTLPSINLMKNSASEVFTINHATSYQHVFGYIRQLAIHLRNSMKIKTKEAYKQVYNWQFAHCVDFWSIVLAKTCDTKAEAEAGKQSELRPLIYPLVQVAVGAIKLVPHGRSHPFHLHILRSLLHLTWHTDTYVPLSTYLVPMLASTLAPNSRPKSSSLKALDFDTTIRVPQQYVKTRVYSEGLVEEATFLLAEWLASRPVHGSIAFPEIVVPISVALKKSLKAGAKNSSSKEQAAVKTLLERLDDSAKWMDQRRKSVTFAPSKLGEVAEWETALRSQLDSAPLGKYLKVQNKAREHRRKLLQKAREGEDEILEE